MAWIRWADEGPKADAPAALPEGVKVHDMPILEGGRGYGWVEGPTLEDCRLAVESLRHVTEWHSCGERDPKWTPPIIGGARA